MGKRVVLLLLLAIIAVFSLASPVLAYEYEPPILFESYADSDADNDIWGANWIAQTFTAESTHTIEAVHLLIERVGDPGILDVYLTAGLGYDVLASGSLNANYLGTLDMGWHQVILDSAITLEAGLSYAIVLAAKDGEALNKVALRVDESAATYAGGMKYTSTNGGGSWTAEATHDCNFKVYGRPALDVEIAQVYSGYLDSNDWLIVVHYLNVYAPYYPNEASGKYFYLRLMDGATTLAQVALPTWGYKPASIYISAARAAALEWGADYTVRMYGDFGTTPYVDYALLGDDWRGTDLVTLDRWCIHVAKTMEDYYGIGFVTYIATKGEVLNEVAGIYFVAGIPSLSIVRPDLFQAIIYTPGFDGTTWTQAQQDEYTWGDMLGVELTGYLTDAGDIFGVSGQFTGGMIVGLAFLAIILVGVGVGHSSAGLLLGSLILGAGMILGLIPLVIIGVIVAVMAFIIVRKFWWSST